MTLTVTPNTDNPTTAIQSAIDTCFLAGGGTVRIEAGDYPISALRLRSCVFLYLCSGVRLTATRDIDGYDILSQDTLEPLNPDEHTDVLWSRAHAERNNDFIKKPGSRWTRAIIRLVHAQNAGIHAEPDVVIDGQNTYDPIGEEHYRGVHGISMYHCRDLTFSGYTIRDTGNWAHCAYDCQNLTFRDLTVLAGHDGVHCSICDNVTIENCAMYTGDDCVAGFDIYGMTVRGCILNTACSAFRLGGTDILIEDCRLIGPPRFSFRGSMTEEEKSTGAPSLTGRKTTLSAFTYYSDFTLHVRHTPRNIVMRRCRFENLERFLHFNFSGNEVWQMNRPLEEITFEDVTAEHVGMSLCAYGDEARPVSLSFRRCRFTFENQQRELIRAAHFSEIRLCDVTAENVTEAAIRCWGGTGHVILENCQGIPDYVADADTPFTCTPI